MSHPIVHVEFSAKDHAEAGKWYADLFGWKITPYPEMNYSTFEAEGGSGGGFNPVSESNPAGRVLVYIQVDDVEAKVKEIEAKGGKIVTPLYEIPNTGWMATFYDPTGNLVALYKSMSQE